MTEKLRDILREPSSMYLVDASVLLEAADAITTERTRADFFRDQLHALHECPTGDDYPCKEGGVCLFRNGGFPDYAACWDEVERRQR